MWARVCIVIAVAVIFAAAPSMLTAYRGSDEQHAGSTATAQNDGSQWVKDKYERLSSLVPLTNWFRFGDTEASATMHAALWNGSAWDLQLSNRMAVNATLDILLGRDERLQVRSTKGGTSSAEVLVLDAGTGWGGTIFFTEAARAAAARDTDAARAASAGMDETAWAAYAAMDSTSDCPLVRYDGLTLSPTQARQANDVASRTGLGSQGSLESTARTAVARFFVTSFDAALPSPPYAVVFAIESLEHSPNLDVTLAHLSGALLPSGMLVVLTDLLSETGERDRDASLLADYQTHWCGSHTLTPTLTLTPTPTPTPTPTLH